MKEDEQDSVGSWLEIQHVLEHEDVVVEGDEAHYSDKVRINESSAVHRLNEYYTTL